MQVFVKYIFCNVIFFYKCVKYVLTIRKWNRFFMAPIFVKYLKCDNYYIYVQFNILFRNTHTQNLIDHFKLFILQF
jgi:hypothetical protein